MFHKSNSSSDALSIGLCSHLALVSASSPDRKSAHMWPNRAVHTLPTLRSDRRASHAVFTERYFHRSIKCAQSIPSGKARAQRRGVFAAVSLLRDYPIASLTPSRRTKRDAEMLSLCTYRRRAERSGAEGAEAVDIRECTQCNSTCAEHRIHN